MAEDVRPHSFAEYVTQATVQVSGGRTFLVWVSVVLLWLLAALIWLPMLLLFPLVIVMVYLVGAVAFYGGALPERPEDVPALLVPLLLITFLVAEFAHRLMGETLTDFGWRPNQPDLQAEQSVRDQRRRTVLALAVTLGLVIALTVVAWVLTHG